MIGNEWTFWEYAFYSFMIGVAGLCDLMLDNWRVVLALVLIVLFVHMLRRVGRKY